MNKSLLDKTLARFCAARNVCGKFKVDRLSRFRTGARQMFTTQKPFASEIPLTMETIQHQILFKIRYQITICQISF